MANEFRIKKGLIVNETDLYVSGSGVGIGNSNPDVKLHIDSDPGISQGTVLKVENSGDYGSARDIHIYNQYDRDIGIFFETLGGTNYIYQDSNGDDSLIFTAGGYIRGTDDTLILYQNHNVEIPNGSLTVSGDITVGGIVTAQEFHTEFVSASIIYQSGSTKFGDTSDDIHSFTGSLQQSGSDSYFLGDVGIGTTSPDQTLHVFKGSAGSIDSNSNAVITAENSGNGYIQLLVPDANESGILFGRPTANADGGILYNSSTTRGLEFRTAGNSTKMVIDSSGNVGIGTTSPSEKLTVAGNISSSGNFDIDGTATVDGVLNVNSYIYIDRADERMIVMEDNGGSNTGYLTMNDSQGNMQLMLGIDGEGHHVETSDGAAKLLFTAHGQDGVLSMNAAKEGTAGADISFSIGLSVDSNDNTVKVGASSDNVGLDAGVGNIVFDASGNLYTENIYARNANGLNILDDGGTLGLFVEDGGNVGIGTTSPPQKLTVEGNISGSGNLYIDGTTNLGATNVSELNVINTSTPTVDIYDSGNAGGGGATGRIRFQNTGGNAIAIGYTDDETDNSNLLITTNANSTYGGYLGLDTAAISDNVSDIILDARTNVILAPESGSVGIGTISPQVKLHIQGDISGSGTLDIGGIANFNDDIDVKTNQLKFYSVSGGSNLIYGQNTAHSLSEFTFESRFDDVAIQAGVNDSNKRDIRIYSGDTKVAEWIVANSFESLVPTTISSTLDVTGIVDIGATDGNGALNVDGVQRWFVGTSQKAYINNVATGVDFQLYRDGTNQGFRVDTRNAASSIAEFDDTSIDFGRNFSVIGNVGIGTTNANAKLHIDNPEAWSAQDLGSSSSGSVAFRITGRNNATNDFIISSNGSTDYTMQVVKDSVTSGELYINPFGGNVGIGTTSPDTKLHIAGLLKLDGGNRSYDFRFNERVNGNGQAQDSAEDLDQDLHLTYHGRVDLPANETYATATFSRTFSVGYSGGTRWFAKVKVYDGQSANTPVLCVNDGTEHNIQYERSIEGGDARDDSNTWHLFDITDDVITGTNTIKVYLKAGQKTYLYTLYVFSSTGIQIPNEPYELPVYSDTGFGVKDTLIIDPNRHLSGIISASFDGPVGIGNTSPTETLSVGDGTVNSRIAIRKADNDVSDHLQFYNGTTRVGEIGTQDDTWLRINQETAKNIYTPRYMRADGGFFVDGTSLGINGDGRLLDGSLTGTYSNNLTFSGTTTFTGNLFADAYARIDALRVGTTSTDPGDGNLYVEGSSTLKGLVTITDDLYPETNYVSNIGSPTKKFLTLNVAELLVETLVASERRSTVGGRFNVGISTQLSQSLSTGTSTIIVENNNLNDGDIIHLEGGGSVEFMKVTSAATNVAGDGYSYTVTRNLDGTGENDWDAGSGIFNTGVTGSAGQSGTGFIDQYAINSLTNGVTTAGPTIAFMERTGSAYSDIDSRTIVGNLKGWYGYGEDTFGFASGDYKEQNITVDPFNGLRIRNVGDIQLQASSSFLSIGDDFLYDSSVGKLYVSGSNIDLVSPSFFLGGDSQYVSGSEGSIEISGSNFHLLNGSITASNVDLSGNINANTGTIGGFTISGDALTGSNFYLSGSATANDFFISSSTFNVKANGDITGSQVLFTGGKITGSDVLIDVNTLNLNAGSGAIVIDSTNEVITVGGGAIRLDNSFGSEGSGLEAINSSVIRVSADGSGTGTSNYMTMFYSDATNWGMEVYGDSNTIFFAGEDGGTIKGILAGFDFYGDRIADNATGDTLILRSNGQISGSSVLFEGGKIGGFTISDTQITDNGATDLILKSNGQITASAAQITGDITSSAALIKGNSKIAGFEITDTQINNSSGTDLILKSDGQITASAAQITGDITAQTGTIGGFTIGNNVLSNGTTFGISGSSTGDNFFISSSRFNVKANGNLTASNAQISGDITATSGQIAKFSINDTTLQVVTGSSILQLGELTNTDSGDLGLNISGSNYYFDISTTEFVPGGSDFYPRIEMYDAINQAGMYAGIIGGITSSFGAGADEFNFVVLGNGNQKVFSAGAENIFAGFEFTDTQINDTGDNLILKSNGQITGSAVLIDGNSKIAGFEVTDSQINDTGDNLILKSNGQITASAAQITGDITATSGELQTLDISGTLTIGTGGTIENDSITITNSEIILDSLGTTGASSPDLSLSGSALQIGDDSLGFKGMLYAWADNFATDAVYLDTVSSTGTITGKLRLRSPQIQLSSSLETLIDTPSLNVTGDITGSNAIFSGDVGIGTTNTATNLGDDTEPRFVLDGRGYMIDTNSGTNRYRLWGMMEPKPIRPSSITRGEAGNIGTNIDTTRFPNVYGESDLSAIDSDATFTYANAVAAAETHGGRLPTLQEVMAGVGQGSGQGYDAEYIWTQTFAGHNRVWVCRGRFDSYPEAKIVDITDAGEVYRVRAAFDVSKANMSVHYDNNEAIRTNILQAQTGSISVVNESGDGLTVDSVGRLVMNNYIEHNGDDNTYFGFSANDTFVVTTAGTQRLIIDSDGEVGIGVSAAGYKLDVSGDVRFINGALGVNVTPNATTGRIDASNDIVSFSSDKRLKTDIFVIKDPIEKVKSLSGFTFKWNEKANELAGYDNDKTYVGVFAQDVEKVLPQAVKPAPFDNDGNDNSLSGENYLTVQYEKLVPLLIEGMKEQQKQIDELKKIVEGITKKDA